MMGAGVFAVWAPAARAAGVGLLIGLVLAAFVAYCNAAASAQLAAVYPVSGGTYVYGREQLGEWWGFLAGWAFVVGKTASCAAMALTFATYAVDGSRWVERLVAVGAVLRDRGAELSRRDANSTADAGAGCLHVARAERVRRRGVLEPRCVVRASARLVGRVALWRAAVGGSAVLRVRRLCAHRDDGRRGARSGADDPAGDPAGVGHHGCCVRRRGVAALVAGGSDLLASSTSPLAAVLSGADRDSVEPVVRVGAALASLGALLALMTGIGRTSLAMAREGDLPRWLAAVHPRYRVPHRAEVALAVVVAALVLTTDLRGALGFSSFGVLLYYAIANASAFTQPAEDRRWPRVLQVIGVVGCLTLAFSLPVASVLIGLAVLAVGLLGRWLRHHFVR